jgi:hypothetical protein
MAGDIDDCKSTSGVVFFLGDGAASWSLQKHKVVALSSCEAEYIAGTVATCQAVWLAGLLGELLVVDAETPKILMDNQSAITLSKNPVPSTSRPDTTSSGNAWIVVKLHWIRWALQISSRTFLQSCSQECASKNYGEGSASSS